MANFHIIADVLALRTSYRRSFQPCRWISHFGLRGIIDLGIFGACCQSREALICADESGKLWSVPLS